MMHTVAGRQRASLLPGTTKRNPDAAVVQAQASPEIEKKRKRARRIKESRGKTANTRKAGRVNVV
jgi:hypothetical protein